MKGSVSHQRLIKYDFEAFKLIVRSESDGYFKENAQASTKHSLPNKKDDGIPALLDATSSMVLSASPSSATGILSLEIRGHTIAQSCIFDIKTRSLTTARPLDMNEVKRRLWVNQTPNFVFAQHTRGRFTDIKKQKIQDDILEWEKENEDLLKRYSAVLTQVVEFVKAVKGKVQVVRIGDGPLQIREHVAGEEAGALSDAMRKRWAVAGLREEP